MYFGFYIINYLDTGNLTEGNIQDVKKLIIGHDIIPISCRKKVSVGDILYSTVRPNKKHYGYLENILENMIVSTGFCVISTKISEAHDKFIYYYLTQEHITEQLHAIAEQSKTTYPSINPSDLINLDIVLSPLSLQKQIASILSCLDDKIEVNQQISKKIDELAQIIFKQWFVDFNFPDKNGTPYKDSGGTMIDSELGKIPKGWRVGKLSDAFTIIMGQSPAGSSYNESKAGVIFFQGRTDFGSRFPSVRLYTTEPKRMANKFDVLISVRAPVGDINLALMDCCIGRGLAAIQSKNKSYCYYKVLALKNEFNVFNGFGTIFGAINKDHLSNLKIILPDNTMIENFEFAVNAIDFKIHNNHVEDNKLQQIRDSLLPKLMSGEIEVSL